MKLLNNKITFKKISIDAQVYFLQCEGISSAIKLKLLNGNLVLGGKSMILNLLSFTPSGLKNQSVGVYF